VYLQLVSVSQTLKLHQFPIRVHLQAQISTIFRVRHKVTPPLNLERRFWWV